MSSGINGIGVQGGATQTVLDKWHGLSKFFEACNAGRPCSGTRSGPQQLTTFSVSADRVSGMVSRAES